MTRFFPPYPDLEHEVHDDFEAEMQAFWYDRPLPEIVGRFLSALGIEME